MPLLDHFHPPLSLRRHWQGFHSAWAGTLARQVNEILPPRYFAEPNVQLGGQVEMDVTAFDDDGPLPAGGSGGARTATAVWAPSRPRLSVPVDFVPPDVFEVRVIHDEEGPRLAAAIELISPANKDRPGHRKAFATKGAGYLQQGVSLVTVDVVTSRSASLHLELLQLLGLVGEDLGPALPLYAASYRAVARSEGACLEVWAEPLALGAGLPVLPLWIEPDYALPLDLEAGYLATCQGLRLPLP
jgi:hypothetical protein